MSSRLGSLAQLLVRAFSGRSPAGRDLHALLMLSSVVSLPTSAFLLRAAIGHGTLFVSMRVAAALVIIIQLVPLLTLFAVDRLIESRAPERLALYRGALMGGAIAMIELHLLGRFRLPFGGPGDSALLEALSIAVAATAVVVVAGATIAATIRWVRPATTLFLFYGPVALLMAFPVVQGIATADGAAQPTADYANRVQAPRQEGYPAVFVVIFDGLSYDALLDEGGRIDRELFPNFATLAGDSVEFTDATASYFWTRYQVPELIDALTPLAGRGETALYLQVRAVEHRYIQQCGITITCYGAAGFARDRETKLVGHMALNTVVDIVPEPLWWAARPLIEAVARRLDLEVSIADDTALHAFSVPIIDRFSADVGRASAGDTYVLHSLLTHFPYVFDENGGVYRSPNSEWSGREDVDDESTYENYRRQLVFADSKLGDLLDALRAAGRYDDSVIIVTADHGLRVDFPSVERKLDAVDGLLTRVPLLIRAPGLAPGRSDVDYQHSDFAATILDLLDVAAGSDGGDAISAFATERPERTRRFYVAADFTRPELGGVTYAYDPADETWTIEDGAGTRPDDAIAETR